MEHRLQTKIETNSREAILQALTLISNPSTSDSRLSSILKPLTLPLKNANPNSNPFLHNYILRLFSLLSDHRPHLHHILSSAVREFSLLPSTSTRSLADSLACLTISTRSLADESAFLSLVLRPCVSIRHWLLSNASELFDVRPSVLLTVLLGFTKDPYPYIRGVALDGLADLCKSIVVEDESVVQGCYFRAVELLLDSEDSVRCSAVRAVSASGQSIIASKQERSRRDWSDALFLQLCSMVRDMSVKVRIEVFNALEKIENVSENILLHNLSKKASSEIKELSFPSQYTNRLLSVPALNPSFAFQHGLEDEFNEVREAACRAVRTLAILSTDFSNKVMILLMGVLNDDSVAVRLQALDTMHHTAMFGCLKLEEEHLHMILGVLLESRSLIRCTAQKVLKVTKFTSLALFKMCVDGLIRDLELYPQDEAEVFSVLFMIGQNHGKFLVDLINQVEKMIEPSSGGKLGYDNARKASYLVLATSAPVSMEQKTCSVPPCLFSYAVTLLGRISRGLADVADQRTLLAYLSYVSRFTFVSKSVFFSNEEHLGKGEVPEIREVMKKFRLKEAKSLLLDCHFEQSKEMDSINIILQVVIDVWPSLKLGCTGVTRTLRSLKAELGMLSIHNHGGELMFVLKYIDALEQLGCLWSHFMFSKEFHPGQCGQLERFLVNLDRCIRDMRYEFIGLTKEAEFLIFELILANCILKLSNIQSPANETVLKKLRSVMSRIEHICGEGSTELSDFVVRVQKSLSENDANILKILENPYFLWKSLEHFSPRKVFSMGNLKYMEAELQFQGNDFQSPLPFISGLPVGVSLDITLHNISSKNRLWIKLRLEENFSQFVFLDLDVIEGSDQLRKFTFVAPFYRTPNANCFSLAVCVVLECISDDDQLFRSCGGPKHEVIHLCEEKEVYFSVAVR